MRNRRRTAAGAIFLVILSCLFTSGLFMLRFRYLFKVGASELPALNDFFQVYYYARDVYVEKVPSEKLLEGAMSGVLESLGDPYSVYMTPAKYKELISRTEGAFGGVGIYVNAKDGEIVVVAPIEGKPGQKAGIKRGDTIVAVDGKEITGLPLDDVLAVLRGQVGTAVTLQIRREGEPGLKEFKITRASIEIDTVSGKLLDNQIGYVQITEFNQNTSEAFQKQINLFRQQNIKGLILDLRNNPGGLLTESKLVAEVLVPRGPIVHIVNRIGERETQNSQSAGLGLPLIVLVNGGSASASEIVAGAVKDRAAGTLVGTKSYGKGSVQGIFTLDNGGGFRLTTDKYLTPSGTSIHGIGIEPDVLVYGPGDRDLDMNSEGDDVVILQQGLNALGYAAGPEDGLYNRQTQAAVRSFQKDQGLTVDGAASRAVIFRLLDAWINAQGEQVLTDVQLERAKAVLTARL